MQWVMLDLLDLLGGILETLCSWRFYMSVAVSLVMVGVIYLSPLDELIRFWTSIVIVVLGVIGGFVWEYKATGRWLD